METVFRASSGRGSLPLKPSLVEWKPISPWEPDMSYILLETFLGGMETIWALVGRANKYILETFLGGMETARQLPGLEQPLDLETFLGGMETLPAPHRSPGLDGALKPSLVEWKPQSYVQSLKPDGNLETFLGGMETQVAGL